MESPAQAYAPARSPETTSPSVPRSRSVMTPDAMRMANAADTTVATMMTIILMTCATCCLLAASRAGRAMLAKRKKAGTARSAVKRSTFSITCGMMGAFPPRLLENRFMSLTGWRTPTGTGVRDLPNRKAADLADAASLSPCRPHVLLAGLLICWHHVRIESPSVPEQTLSRSAWFSPSIVPRRRG